MWKMDALYCMILKGPDDDDNAKVGVINPILQSRKWRLRKVEYSSVGTLHS